MKISWKKFSLVTGILFLLVLVGAIFITAFQVKEVKKRQEIRTRAAPATTLSFSPSTKTVGINEAFSLEVKINTGTNTVSAAALYISYDKTKLEAQSIQNGTFLPNVLVPGAIDSTNGIVSITLGSSPTEPKRGTGTLAVLNLKALSLTNTNPTVVRFTSQTQVAAIGETGNVLTGTTPSSINIQNASLSFSIKFQGVNTQRANKTIKVVFKKGGNTVISFDNVEVTANTSGVYRGSVNNVSPDTYDVFVKGAVHLQKKFSGITLSPGGNNKDWTGTILKTGDAVAIPSSSFNKIDIYDYNKIVEHFGPKMPSGGSPADFDFDNDVDIFDYNFLVGNFNQTGD